jgi:hypothetical protein
MLVHITDRTDPARDAVVDVLTVAPLIAGWLFADGMITGEPSRNVLALVESLRTGHWGYVHALADFLSLTVEVVK